MTSALNRVLNLTCIFVLPGAGALGALVMLLQGRVAAIHLVLFTLGFLVTGLHHTSGTTTGRAS